MSTGSRYQGEIRSDNVDHAAFQIDTTAPPANAQGKRRCPLPQAETPSGFVLETQPCYLSALCDDGHLGNVH
jgi:hypothetical protein